MRLNQLPDFVDKCRVLVNSQFNEADRALIGRGEMTLRPGYIRHRLTLDVWQRMSERKRARDECFRLPSRADTSVSDGALTVTHRPDAGKKKNQNQIPRAQRTLSANISKCTRK
jgi:hypothetical protein